MAIFLLTATDPSGRRESLRIDAETSQEACERLERDGYRDIVLHTSDVEASMKLKSLESDELTSADLVTLRGASRFGFFWFLLTRLYAKSRIMVGIAIVFLLVKWWTSESLGFLGYAAMVVACAPLAIAIVFTFVGMSNKYNALINAQAWGHWQEVLDRAPALQGGPQDYDVAVREACALAALGRLGEGLKKLEDCAATSKQPRWMHLSRLAEVYDSAHQHAKALEYHQLAYQEAPDDSTIQLGLAMSLLMNETDATQAKQLIEMAEAQRLSDAQLMILPYIKGLYALNTRNFSEAKQHFQTAHKKLSAMAAASPLVGVVIDMNRGWLAIALANLREHQEAEKLYQMARPRIVALNSLRILNRMNQALGKK